MKKYLLSLLLLLLLVLFCFLNKNNEKFQEVYDFNSNRNNLKIPFIIDLVDLSMAEIVEDINKKIPASSSKNNYLTNILDNYENYENYEDYLKLLYILLNLKVNDYDNDNDNDNYYYKNIEVKIFNVSNIKTMKYLFYFTNEYYKNKEPKIDIFEKINIGNWDVSNVTNMSYMFQNCETFNKDLSKWNVSNVQYMSNMFYGCIIFDKDLNSWGKRLKTDVNMRQMFMNCNKWNNGSHNLNNKWKNKLRQIRRINPTYLENIFNKTTFIEDDGAGISDYNINGPILQYEVANVPYENRTSLTIYDNNKRGQIHGQGRLNSPQAWSSFHLSNHSPDDKNVPSTTRLKGSRSAHFKLPREDGSETWATIKDEFYQLDLGSEKTIHGIRIQGRGNSNPRYTNQHVTALDINIDDVFKQSFNNIQNTKDSNPELPPYHDLLLDTPVIGRFVKLNNFSASSHLSMRVDVLLIES